MLSIFSLIDINQINEKQVIIYFYLVMALKKSYYKIANNSDENGTYENSVKIAFN